MAFMRTALRERPATSRRSECVALARSSGTRQPRSVRLIDLAFVLCAASVAGCYLSHERPARTEDARTDDDAGRDGGADAPIPPVGPPRLLAPSGTSTVTSSRPTLRWVLGSAATEGRVELCRERACTAPIETITGTTSARPSSDLSPGWYFWRVGSGDRTSATWQFRVGVRTGPVDSFWGVALDLDGDGIEDTVRSVVTGGDTNTGVFRGTTSGSEAEPYVVIPSTASCNAGAFATSAGDVNGDGFADLMLTETSDWCRPGVVRVLLGGPSGVSPTPQRTLLDFMPTRPGYGRFALGLGDVDGDGYGDLAIGVRENYGDFGPLTAEVFRGSPTGIVSDRGQQLDVGEISFRSELPPLVAGDTNGDGFADLIVGPSIFLGASSGLGAPAFVFDRHAKAAATGDVNGDGFADWAISSDVIDPRIETARVSVFLGSAAGLGGMPATVLVGPDQYFGRHITLSDLNGDGFSDLTISGTPGTPPPYFGSAGGLVVP